MAKKKVPPFLATFYLSNGEDIEPWKVLREFASKLKTQSAFVTPDADTWLRDLVWAAQVVLSPGRVMEYLEVGHEVYVARHADEAPQVDRKKPWYGLVLAEMLPHCELRREERGNVFDCMGGMYREVLEVLPEHLRAEALRGTVGDDPASLLAELLERRDATGEKFFYAELHHRNLAPAHVEFGFWRLAPNSKNQIKLGQANVVSKKDRQLSILKNPPFFRVMLALDYWLCATREERLRLLHHELMHCQLQYKEDELSASLLEHDVEEFILTAHHFGSASANQDAVANALARKPSPKSLGHSQLSLSLRLS